jgi:ABC-type Fe3+-hydroxamate transport system substrate-binding protein
MIHYRTMRGRVTQNQIDTPRASTHLFPAGKRGIFCLQSGGRTLLLPAALLLSLACEEGSMRATPPPSSAHLAESVAPAVVSLSPGATRFVEALGAKHRLVGVDPISSQALSGKPLPEVDLQAALQLGPDLILVGELPRSAEGGPFSSSPAEYVEFAPHNLEELFALSRTLGRRLVGSARATRFELEIARPLALIGGTPFGGEKPRVAAVLGLAPTRLAGGHTFATDAIEIAGGTSVTHEANLNENFEPSDEDWLRLAPDLVLVLSAEEMPAEAKRDARSALPSDYPVRFFVFDSASFWSDGPAQTTARLKSFLKAHVQGQANTALPTAP